MGIIPRPTVWSLHTGKVGEEGGEGYARSNSRSAVDMVRQGEGRLEGGEWHSAIHDVPESG